MAAPALLLPLVPVLLSAAQGSPGDPDDAALRRALDHLSEEDLAEAAEWYRFEVAGARSESARSIASALALLDIDRGFLPLDEPAPFYDPSVHTPGQGARRRWLDADSKRVERQREAFGLVPSDGAPRVAFRYDWASRQVRRRAEPLSARELLENALHGVLPDYGLARALLLQHLDDGAQAKAHAGFGHAYADRQGNVFPGITLYDAWCSGKTIEMPDVDTLGLVHDLLGDWERWKAPVPPSQHDALYGTLGELFVPARRARALRETAADLFLCADPKPPGLYLPAADALGALWVDVEYDVDAYAERLPAAKDIATWIEKRRAETAKDATAWRDFEARRSLLRREAALPRAALVRVLRGLGALPE